MRQIKEVLRLRQEHQLSVREIARSCGLPASTVGDYLKRAAAAGLSWPLPEEWDDEQLGRKLLAVGERPPEAGSGPPTPEWPRLHEELRRKGVTLRLHWQEYRQNHPAGYSYSRYCQLYEAWAKNLEPTLRQVHAPGEKLFVDWACFVRMAKTAHETETMWYFTSDPPKLAVQRWPALLPIMSRPSGD